MLVGWVSLAACGRIGFEAMTEDADLGGDGNGSVDATSLCGSSDPTDANGNGIPDACDPCLALGCEDHGVPQGGYPRWEERAFLVALNAARSAQVTYRDRFMEFADASGGQVFTSGPLPLPPLVYDRRLNQGSRFHASDRASCHPGPGNVESLCDGTPRDTWWVPYMPLRGYSFLALVGPTSRELPVYQNVFHICGSWWADLKARNCPDDTLAIRQELFLVERNLTVGKGFAPVSGDVASYWTMLFSDVGPTTPQPPIASASHFFFRDELYFGLNAELALSPQAVYLVLDGVRHTLPLDLGATTRGMYAIKMPETAGCRSYYMLLVDDAGAIWRYPGRGSFRTYGEGGCTEDYVP